MFLKIQQIPTIYFVFFFRKMIDRNDKRIGRREEQVKKKIFFELSMNNLIFDKWIDF